MRNIQNSHYLVFSVPKSLFNMSLRPHSASKQNFESNALDKLNLTNANPGDITKLLGAN